MTEADKAIILMLAANGQKLNVIAAKLSSQSAAECDEVETDLCGMLAKECPAIVAELDL